MEEYKTNECLKWNLESKYDYELFSDEQTYNDFNNNCLN